MIGFWRKHTKSFVIHLVFWPIIAVFIIWGFEKSDNDGVGGAAAVVNGKTITVAEYRNALQRMIDFYSQMMQGNFDENAQRQYRVKEAALRQLINSELVTQQAHKIGLQVTDAEVRRSITEIPMLQKDGRFSRENYDSLLKYYRMSASQFEDNLRKEALIEKTRRLFEKSLNPSQSELDKEKTLSAQKMNLEFLRLEKEQLAGNVSATDAEVESFVKDAENQNQLKEYFDLHKSEFSHPEQIRARHILVKADRGNKVAQTQALEKIAKIKEELNKSSFESLAKKYSDDPGSKNKGGDLDWFDKGRMVPEFEKVAFESPIGKISEPVQTNFGYHFIKVEGKKAAESTPFDVARVTIAKKLVAQKKIEKALADADKKIANDPNGALKELESITKGVKWEQTGTFSFSDDRIPKIGEYDEVVNAAFSLTPQKPVFPKLIQVGSAVYVLRYKNVDSKALPVAEPPMMGGNSKDLGRNVYTAWTSKLVEKAKIKPNPQIFAEDAQAP